jgi:hypothetical protein
VHIIFNRLPHSVTFLFLFDEMEQALGQPSSSMDVDDDAADEVMRACFKAYLEKRSAPSTCTPSSSSSSGLINQ